MIYFRVMSRYFYQIRSGAKKVEGRLAKPKYANLKPGDLFFFVSQNGDELQAEVLKVILYSSFSEMIGAEGYRTLIPDAHSSTDVLKQYLSLDGYKEGERQLGVCAIHFNLK